MQKRHLLAILFCVVVLVSLGCNPAIQLPNSQNTQSVQEIPTPTPTSYLPNPIYSPTPVYLPTPAPHYKVTGQNGETTYSGVACDLEKPFTFKANFEPWWEMNLELTPASAQAGTFTLTGTHRDAGPYTGEGVYTISPANEGTYQLTLNFTTFIQHLEWPGPVDLLSQGPISYHPTLVPFDTQECNGQ